MKATIRSWLQIGTLPLMEFEPQKWKIDKRAAAFVAGGVHGPATHPRWRVAKKQQPAVV